ncbi:hypothetical protein H310_07895 [Aphanomyces invadans]|uniref:Bax inhibitor 1 n=1 Tax=Aphanomyces invadans TaxID=157072 RepID=A0A024U0X3_9STRA|nr:hypothetical protein H310_07895 [Aphanomyces invadans]ETV99859.1 hypothetical protein H310_07895 [Aphanomyces invadans]|eukprot:XP_008871635.1 hypothetical protein H310_07895 [Aphanomyces invadans]
MTTFQSMADRFSNRAFDFAALLKTNDISAAVQKHLVNVYTTLATTLLVAAIGVVADIKFTLAGALSGLGVIGLLFYLHFIHINDTPKRLSVLYAIAFATGVNTGPLVSIALDVNPMLVATALFGTSVIFACFTGSAMLEKRRSYFFLYSAISSAILCLSLIQLVNIFVRSSAVYTVELYAGLLIFCGYVLLDTQMIIEKASLGDRDFVLHSLDLFLDFVSIFVRILVVLLKNAENKDNDRKRRQRS